MSSIGFVTNDSNVMKVSVPLNDFKHALFIGKTGSGKTSGAITPAINSRIEAGYGMLIFDEKGKEHKTVKLLGQRHGRLEDVLEIGKPHGIRINMLYEVSERQLERFIRNVIKGDDNWMEGAINMFMEVYRWLNCIKEFYHLSIVTFGCEPYAIKVTRPSEVVEDQEVKINHEISNEPITLAEITHYFKSSTDFIIITQLSERYVDLIARKIQYRLESLESINDTPIEKLYQADAIGDELVKLSNSIKAYRIKTNTSEASGNNGLYFMVGSTLGLLGSDCYINDPQGVDIAALLNAGKIVIVNTESFSDRVLCDLLNKTLSSLLIRAKLGAKVPISIVIDEANRVLTFDSDIHIDIMRESKVELIIAMQNEAQMRVKMGAEKWESLADNFNTRYTFLGPNPFKPKIHRVIDDRTDHTLEADAMFFDEKELNDAEHVYQQTHGYYEHYKTSIDEIAIYDHLLFEKKKCILMHNLHSNEMREISIRFAIDKVKSTEFRNYAENTKSVNEPIHIINK